MTADDCLSRFKSAVREGRDGRYEEAQQIVESVRQKHGENQAQVAKKELWAYMTSGKKA